MREFETELRTGVYSLDLVRYHKKMATKFEEFLGYQDASGYWKCWNEILRFKEQFVSEEANVVRTAWRIYKIFISFDSPEKLTNLLMTTRNGVGIAIANPEINMFVDVEKAALKRLEEELRIFQITDQYQEGAQEIKSRYQRRSFFGEITTLVFGNGTDVAPS